MQLPTKMIAAVDIEKTPAVEMKALSPMERFSNFGMEIITKSSLAGSFGPKERRGHRTTARLPLLRIVDEPTKSYSRVIERIAGLSG